MRVSWSEAPGALRLSTDERTSDFMQNPLRTSMERENTPSVKRVWMAARPGVATVPGMGVSLNESGEFDHAAIVASIQLSEKHSYVRWVGLEPQALVLAQTRDASAASQN